VSDALLPGAGLRDPPGFATWQSSGQLEDQPDRDVNALGYDTAERSKVKKAIAA